MPRPRKPEQVKLVNVGLTVPPTVDEFLAEIAEQEDRSKSYVARALLIRGVDAYRQDGQLVSAPVDESLPHGGRKTVRIRAGKHLSHHTDKGLRKKQG